MHNENVNIAPGSNLMRYRIGKTLFNLQGAGNKTHKIPYSSLWNSLAKWFWR